MSTDRFQHLSQHDTLPKLVRYNARTHGADIAQREKEHGRWKIYSWQDVETRAKAWAAGFQSLGVGGPFWGIITIFLGVILAGWSCREWMFGEPPITLGEHQLGVALPAIDLAIFVIARVQTEVTSTHIQLARQSLSPCNDQCCV